MAVIIRRMAKLIGFAAPDSLLKKGEHMHRAVWLAGVCFISMVWLLTGNAHKSHAQLPGWVDASPNLVGEVRFRLFIFDIYHAALFAPDGSFDGMAPYALKLSYLRDVSSQTITETSVDEMRRQGVTDEDRLVEWAVWMEQTLHHVSKDRDQRDQIRHMIYLLSIDR